MSTHTHQTEPEPATTTAEQFTTLDAPRTFSPYNTHDCPQLFADRWATEPDDARR